MNWFNHVKQSYWSRKGNGPLWDLLNSETTKKTIAGIVQKVYDDWHQDEEGYDWQVGSGGICNLVADGISSYLYGLNVMCKTYDAEDDHTAVVAASKDECYHVDVHWSHYEICNGMYCYTKIKDVQMTPDIVDVCPVPRDVLMDEETGEIPEEWVVEDEDEY